MNKNQQKVSLAATAIIAIMALHPPFLYIGFEGRIRNTGYAWISEGAEKGVVNVSLLWTQIFVVLFIGGVLYLLLNKSDNILSDLLKNISKKKGSTDSNKNNTQKSGFQLFHGGDGLSKNSPVNINCASMEVAKKSIDRFIIDNCGDDCKRTDFEYTIANPNDSDKLIKVIPVKKPDGTEIEFFFDLSRQIKNFTNIVNMFGDKD